MIEPSIIGAGISAGANILGSLSANKANVGLAREQMQFQERMANTSVQRHTADLEKAGFNRLLAVSGGSVGGASVPTGARAEVENPMKSLNPLDLITIQKVKGDIARTAAEEKLIKANTTTAEANGDIARHDASIITGEPLPSKSQTGVYGAAFSPLHKAGVYLGEKAASLVNYFKNKE